MTLTELLKLLNNIKKVHPEAKTAEVMAMDEGGYVTFINFVGYDTKKKHNRILLEE